MDKEADKEGRLNKLLEIEATFMNGLYFVVFYVMCGISMWLRTLKIASYLRQCR